MEGKKATADQSERVIARSRGYCSCCGSQRVMLIVQTKFPFLFSPFIKDLHIASTYLVCDCCGVVVPILGSHVMH